MAPRYYKKRYYKGSRDKYSVENRCATLTLPAYPTQSQLNIVPQTGVEGMRKVKHLTVTMSSEAEQTTGVYWALVYVPEGYNPNNLNLTGGASLYEPNQNVMACGVMDFSAGPCRVYSRLSRNLNSGDRIVLVVASTNASSTINIACVVSYAITLQ